MRTNMQVLGIIILLAALASPTVYAADIALRSSCTLADAIIAANLDRAEGRCRVGRGADTITLTRDITLNGGLPKITSTITIDGNGYTISGGNHYRIFYNDGGALTIHDLTMTQGRAEGEIIRNTDGVFRNTTAQPVGGAILNLSGTVTISNSSFSGNSAREGGAVFNWSGAVSISDSSFSDNSAERSGGAITNWGYGELSIISSTFSDNSAERSGGAITNWGYGELSIDDSAFSGNSAEGGGGAIDNLGELNISSSTFSGNSAKYGGAIDNLGELSIISSTFSDNSAERRGGAITNWGDGELSISDSTFSGNSAKQGGAITNRGYGELSVISSTFSDNSADEYGGAIYNWNWVDGGGELSMVNSIIAGRGGDACYSESLLKQNIRNFIQDGSCDAALRGNPMLGELVIPADGSPPYFPLRPGSRAIDAADDRFCPPTDQLGQARPQGAGCDIGAVEYVPG